MTNSNGMKRIWWAVTGIIVFLMLFASGTVGYAIQDSKAGSENTTNIEGIKESLVRIEKNIERLLDR